MFLAIKRETLFDKSLNLSGSYNSYTYMIPTTKYQKHEAKSDGNEGHNRQLDNCICRLQYPTFNVAYNRQKIYKEM